MIKISEAIDEFFSKIFPHLKDELRSAQMKADVVPFVIKCFILAMVFSLTLSVTAFLLLSKYNLISWMVPIFLFFDFFVPADFEDSKTQYKKSWE